MSSISNSSMASTGRKGRFGTFWERITDGFALHELWSQFKSEAKASYRLYSADVDWHDIDGKSSGKLGRFGRSAWALFQAMLMKLSPARRVLLLERWTQSSHPPASGDIRAPRYRGASSWNSRVLGRRRPVSFRPYPASFRRRPLHIYRWPCRSSERI